MLFSACSVPTGTPTQAAAPPSPTPSPEPSLTPTPTLTPSPTPQPLTDICTPLFDHDLSQLPDFLTQPFIPPLGANREQGHHGVDFAYYRRDGVGGHINGTPIQSVLDGRVAGLGYNPVYGNYLIVETSGEWLPRDVNSAYSIQSGQSLYLLYAHMQELAPLALGDPLACAQQVGLVGGTGDQYFVSDPHLHFETRVGPAGVIMAPMSYYTTSATEEEKAEYEYWRSSETFILFDPMLLLSLGIDAAE